MRIIHQTLNKGQFSHLFKLLERFPFVKIIQIQENRLQASLWTLKKILRDII